MLDKTADTARTLTKEDLAIGTRFACTVGNGRQIEMTTGIPLDWEKDKINEVLDLMAGAMDRQTLRYRLKDLEQVVEQGTKDLRTSEYQRDMYEQKAKHDFDTMGRRGEWKPSDSQRKQIENFDQSQKHLREHLVITQKQIDALKEQIG